jgi:hypothetical protein
MNRIRQIINEAVRETLLFEAIKSSWLKRFFAEHGGVDSTMHNDYLGDAQDEDIEDVKVFPSKKEAFEMAWKLRREHITGFRKVYVAKDGTAVLVVYKDSVKSNPTWGGEASAKTADRYWRNGERFTSYNPETGQRVPGYRDDRGTYTYSDGKSSEGAARFGIRNSDDYRRHVAFVRDQRAKAKQNGKEDDFNRWRDAEAKRVKDYAEEKKKERDWQREYFGLSDRERERRLSRPAPLDKRFK